MKRPLVIGLTAVAALFIFVRYQAQLPQNNSTQNNPNPQEQFQTKRFEVMLEDREYALLATKYGVPRETTKSIFADYDLSLWGVSSHDLEKRGPIFPEATNTSEVITALSNKYGIPSATVASLLIDKTLLEERDSAPEPVESEEPLDPNDY